jgi:hypothetical protein
MGIVVSEDANRGRNEQQKIDAIVAENDYGLVMVTLDQISVFLGSWWTTSLIGRIQVMPLQCHHEEVSGLIVSLYRHSEAMPMSPSQEL